VQGKQPAPAGDAFERARATLKSRKPLRDRFLRQAAEGIEHTLCRTRRRAKNGRDFDAPDPSIRAFADHFSQS
jgi:hypothetical protein